MADTGPSTLDLSKRAPLRFLQVGNGKETPENVVLLRFYTAWTHCGHSASTVDLAMPNLYISMPDSALLLD